MTRAATIGLTLSALSVLTLLTASLATGPAAAQVGANMKDQLIFRVCRKAMAADFQKAGKSPPAGMVEDTCGCVVQEINRRASIQQAKATCQAKALKTYSLE